MIGYLDKDIRPLVFIMPKMIWYVKAFKAEGKVNKLVSFRIDDKKLLEKYKAIWTKIEDSKNIKLNALPVNDDKYIKTKTGIYGNKVYNNFHGLNVPECESFAVISIDSLLVCRSKFYLQVCLFNCGYKIAKKQITDCLDENLFED